MEQLPAQSQIPLLIGITGHREIPADQVLALEAEIGTFLENLRKEFPHTPLILLSALGPGADQLGAKVALQTNGVDLVVVLPWADGICDETRRRAEIDPEIFDQLLEAASSRICLPLPQGISPDEIRNSETARQECFAAVSRYITRHSEYLIAIWDGVEVEESQTWQVIKWHRKGSPAPFAIGTGHLDQPESGPLLHLKIERGDDAEAGLEPMSVELVEAEEARRKRFREIAGNLDRFNRDVVQLGEELAGGIETAKGYVFPKEERAELPVSVRFAIQRFAVADQLALYWQKRSQLYLVGILGLIFLTVTCFEIYAHVLPGQWGWLLAYPILFFTGIWVVRKAREWRIYNRYLDSRALAEAMRVHLFWDLAGLPENAVDFYLRSYRSQLDWIRVALRSWAVQSGQHDCESGCAIGSEPRLDDLRKVSERWIKDQCDYFQRSWPREEDRAHRCHLWSRIFLGISLGIAGVQIGRLIWGQYHHLHLGHDHLTHYLIVAIAMGGVLGGLCHEFLEKRLFEKHARSYRWMASLYEIAQEKMNRYLAENDPEAARELIRELGREALAENADWVIYHREREPEMKGH